MPIPLTRGKPYYAMFSATSLLPEENGTFSTNIGPKYSFAPGNTVIVTRSINALLRFEAVVSTYDSSTGDIELYDITNIKSSIYGNWPATGDFIMTLAGERGSKITSGTDAPDTVVGREGDMYINTSTGEVYIKS